MARETCTWSVLQFCISIAGQERDSRGRGNDGGRFTRPGWRIVQYKKNFVDVASLQCEGAAIGVAGAAKVA